ncbi:MAG TPA: ABC transporter substrate-binding protein [Fervidobacterium nodosum]|nr:ABC transporter substrate-binding protein [Fervidobacterium nodosum]
MNMKKFLVYFLMIFIALSVFATDFFVEDKMLTSSAQPKVGGTLRLALPSTPESFLLYGSLDSSAYSVIMGPLMSPLVEYHPITNEIRPALAKSWTVSNDGKQVWFYLRDAYWSDGKPITADDVIFTMEYFVMNKYARGNSVDRFTIPGEKGVNKPIKWTKINNKVVRADLPSPYGAFLTVLTAVYIYPKHKLEPLINKNDLASVNKLWLTNTPPSEIVVNGPYKLSQVIVDQKIVLERNPYFWKKDPYGNQLPYFDKLEYLIIKDAEIRLAKFIAGEIDYTAVSASDYPRLKQLEVSGNAPYILFASKPIGSTPSPVHISFNFDTANPKLKELFRKLEFREAMEYALNRGRIIEEVYNGLAIPGGGLVLPTNKAFYNPKIEQLMRPFDLKKAASLLDSLGIVDKNKDGLRDFPDGSKFEFTILVQNSPKDYQQIAYIFSDELQKIGVKTNLQILDSSVVGQMFGAGNFECGIRAFGNQPDPQLRKAIWQPGQQLYYWHYSTMNKETNPPSPVFSEMFDWEKRIWEIFEKAQIEMNPKKRKTLYDEWQELYYKYLPVIFVARQMNFFGAHKSIGNVVQSSEGLPTFTVWTTFRK